MCQAVKGLSLPQVHKLREACYIWLFNVIRLLVQTDEGESAKSPRYRGRIPYPAFVGKGPPQLRGAVHPPLPALIFQLHQPAGFLGYQADYQNLIRYLGSKIGTNRAFVIIYLKWN